MMQMKELLTFIYGADSAESVCDALSISAEKFNISENVIVNRAANTAGARIEPNDPS